jgi:hypothetical protein
MSHLGRWLSAQVDGELDGVERDRVLNHLAGCEACRQEARALRALKRRMTALGDSAAETAIAGKLMELARSDQDLLATAITSSWGAMRAGTRQPRLSWRIATGSAGSALLAIGVIAFMLGGAQPNRPVPGVTPAVDAYWTEHIYDTGETPATGSAQSTGPLGGSSTGLGPAGQAPAQPAPAQSGSAKPRLAGSGQAEPAQSGPGSARSASAGSGPVGAAVTGYAPVTGDPASSAVLLRIMTP